MLNARLTCRSFLAVALISGPGAAVAHADVLDDIGYTALVARLGKGNVPDGSGYGMGQVEAEESPGNFGPITSTPGFAGKTFTPMSGPFGGSNHATTVGLNLYGTASSIAAGVSAIFVWSANSWVTTGYLKTNQGSTPPALPPAGMRIFNSSWIGSFGSSFADNDALRRFDFAIQRDNLIAVNGTNNGAGSPAFALVGYGYNGLTVGLANGLHSNATAPTGLDGPGRRKPEIVAPAGFTSFSTPIVGAAAALLLETTDLDPGLTSNPNADRNIVIKSVLLAGANHRASWNNGAVASGPNRGTAATPLDPLYGADLLNVDRSHWILTGRETDGQASVPAGTTTDDRGWDWIPSLAANASVYYRFRAYGPTAELSVLATWNRSVATNFGSFSLMDLDLQLWRVNASGGLASLVGDAGVPYFTSGNVLSASTIDNLEHLYVKGLAAGDYVIELKRKAGTQAALPIAVAWYMTDTGPFGDLDGDDLIGPADLAILLANWGGSGVGDLDGNGLVGAADLTLLLGAWSF